MATKKNNLESKRYGRVDLLKFYLALNVFLSHLTVFLGRKSITIFGHTRSIFIKGWISNDIFFIISGFFIAKTIKNKLDEKNGPDLWIKTLVNKFKPLFIPYIVTYVISAISYLILHCTGYAEYIKYIVKWIPSLFLLQMTGITHLVESKNYVISPNGATWFLSSMIIVMCLLIPLLYKYYEIIAKYLALPVSLILWGQLSINSDIHVSRVLFHGCIYYGNITCLAGILMGVFLYEFSLKCKEIKQTKKTKIALSIFEVILVAGMMLYFFVEMDIVYDMIFRLSLPVMFLLVVINDNVFIPNKIFDNRFVYFLGKLSIDIWLTHLASIYIVQILSKYNETVLEHSWTYAISITFLLSLMVYFIDNRINAIIKKRK